MTETSEGFILGHVRDEKGVVIVFEIGRGFINGQKVRERSFDVIWKIGKAHARIWRPGKLTLCRRRHIHVTSTSTYYMTNLIKIPKLYNNIYIYGRYRLNNCNLDCPE